MQKQKASNKIFHSLFKTPQNLGMYDSSDSLKKSLTAAFQAWVFNFNEKLVSRALLVIPTCSPNKKKNKKEEKQ